MRPVGRLCAPSLSTGGPSPSPPPQVRVNTLIQDHDVMVFSKSMCPFCLQVKAALQEMQLPFHAVELDTISEGASMQQFLLEKTGQRTVPNVFIKGNHVGGCDDTLAALRSGKLQSLLLSGGSTS